MNNRLCSSLFGRSRLVFRHLCNGFSVRRADGFACYSLDVYAPSGQFCREAHVLAAFSDREGKLVVGNLDGRGVL